MEISLKFKLTFIDGGISDQTINIPADPKLPIETQMMLLMQKMLTQYAQVGVLREPTPGTFKLICPSQLKSVECEMPSILLANANEVPKTITIIE